MIGRPPTNDLCIIIHNNDSQIRVTFWKLLVFIKNWQQYLERSLDIYVMILTDTPVKRRIEKVANLVR